MREINVYLSGPMYKTREESVTWRNEVKKILNNYTEHGLRVKRFNVLDPCDRWFDDKEQLDKDSGWVVKIDKMEIARADVLIVNANEPGWGTPMEQYLAYESGKFIIAFCDKELPSIWAKEHCHIMLTNHVEAAMWLCMHSSDIAKTL